MPTPNTDYPIHILNHWMSLEEISQAWGISLEETALYLLRLEEEGLPIEVSGDKIRIRPEPADPHSVPKYTLSTDKPRIRIGIVSDTHGGSRQEQLRALHEFYDRAIAMGVRTFIHAGDIAHGMKVYRGQEVDLKIWGYGAQLRHILQTYPRRPGVKTYFILGNHDEDYLKSGFGDPGSYLSQNREDLVYLGPYQADLEIDGFRIRLQHGAKNVPYALSYHLQRYISNLPLQNRPHVFVLGHYHSYAQINYQSVFGILPMSFMGPNLLSSRLGLETTIGGIILDIEIDGHMKITQFQVLTFEVELPPLGGSTENIPADG